MQSSIEGLDGPCKFQDLPREILIQILSFLHYSYVVADISLVNKQFHYLVCGDGEFGYADAQKLWSAVCEHQFIPLHSEDECVVQRVVHLFPMLQIDSVEINVLDREIAKRYLEALAPNIDYLEFSGPYDLGIQLEFPKLSQLHLTNTSDAEDDVLSLFCSGDKSKLNGIKMDDVSSISGFTHLKRIETITASNPHQFAKLIEDNKDTLRKLEYTDEMDTDIDGSPILNVILKCSRLKIIRLGDLYIPYSDALERGEIIFKHLTTINIRVSTAFVEQFFAHEHPKLQAVTLGLQEFDHKSDLSNLQFQNLTTFWLYLWNEPPDWEAIKQLLSCVRSKIDDFGIYSEFSVRLNFVKHIRQVRELGLMGSGVSHLIQPLVKQVDSGLSSLELKYIENFDVASIQSAHNLQILTILESTVSTCDVNDITYVIRNHPKLRDMSVNGFSLAKTSVALKLIEPKNIRVLELDQEGRKSSDLFYLLPSYIEEVRISLNKDATIEDWIIVALCCHRVQKVEMQYDEFPIRQLISKTSVLSFSSDFVKRLKRRVIEQIENRQLMISTDERQELQQSYNRLFESEHTFANLLEKYPAITTLYRCACSAFYNLLAGS